MNAKKNITKNDLVKLVMSKSNFNRHDAYLFVENFFEVIIKSLESGKVVKIPSFGNFTIRNKKARIGRNPKTKEEFPISARKVVSFRTSNIFKELVNIKPTTLE